MSGARIGQFLHSSAKIKPVHGSLLVVLHRYSDSDPDHRENHH